MDSNTELIKKQINSEIDKLNTSTLKEILNFIKFLQKKSSRHYLSDLNKASTSHLEEEFKEYQKKYPVDE